VNEYFGTIGEKLTGKFSNNNKTEFRKFFKKSNIINLFRTT